MATVTATPLIEARAITKTIGDGVSTTLVRDIDMSIAPGEFVAHRCEDCLDRFDLD